MIKMRKALIPLILILFTFNVYADIYMSSPLWQTVKDKETIMIGSIEPGQTVSLIFSTTTGIEGKEFKTATAMPVDLPQGWKATTSVSDESIQTKIFVPLTAASGLYNFKVRLQNKEAAFEETFVGRVSVEYNLLSVVVSSPEQAVAVNEPANFTFKLTNNSIANYHVLFDSSLSESWFRSATYLLGPNKSDEFFITVTPRISGLTEFNFYVEDVETGYVYAQTTQKLLVKPTLQEKFGSSFYGFPFFTLSLLPFHMFNSFISIFLP